MAGGANAAIIPCWECAERADRIYEGDETDRYLCSACACQFGIDWESSGSPEAPLWPPTAEERQRILAPKVLATRDRVIERLGQLAQARPGSILPETELCTLSPSLLLIQQWIADLHKAFGVDLSRDALRMVGTVGDVAMLIARAKYSC